MQEIHIRLPEITALVIALSTLIGSVCSGIASVLGAINHRRIAQVQAGQRRLEDSVNGRVEELANAKAGQALLNAAAAANGGRVLVQTDVPQEGLIGHVE